MKTILLILMVTLPACGETDPGQASAFRAKSMPAEQTLVSQASAPERDMSGGMPPSGDRPRHVTGTKESGTGPGNIPAQDPSASMIIRNGTASVEVRTLDPAVAGVTALAARLGGHVANSSVTGGRNEVRSAMLEVKVPAQRYGEALSGLSAFGTVENANTNAQDVGEEYVDLTARINNARRLEERLLTLLATRAGKLEDILAVERELARVRQEIEQIEGRLRFLRSRAAMSTLTVTLHEPYPILGRTPGRNPIAEAVEQAWRNFVGFIAAFIASLGVVIPLGAVAVLGYLGFRKYIRPRMQR